MNKERINYWLERGRLSAIRRCEIVMSRDNGIAELMERKKQILIRSVNHSGGPETICDEAEIKEIDRILSINELNLKTKNPN